MVGRASPAIWCPRHPQCPVHQMLTGQFWIAPSPNPPSKSAIGVHDIIETSQVHTKQDHFAISLITKKPRLKDSNKGSTFSPLSPLSIGLPFTRTREAPSPLHQDGSTSLCATPPRHSGSKRQPDVAHAIQLLRLEGEPRFDSAIRVLLRNSLVNQREELHRGAVELPKTMVKDRKAILRRGH